jgi:hypothetical protein
MQLRKRSGLPCLVMLASLVVALPAAAGPPEGAARGGAPRQKRVLRSWTDTIKGPAGEVSRRMEVVFDYAERIAFENAYALDGTLLGSRPLLHEQPRPSKEEVADAIAILRADPVVGRIMERTKADPLGAFILEEPEDGGCGPRTRCLQVLLVSPDHRGLLRRVVVDMARDTIVYRAYVPSEEEVVR